MCPLAAIFCLAAWQPHTAVLEGVSDSLFVLDGLQTSRLVSEGRYERESDIIIGHHPTAESTALYFGGIALTHLLLENALEKVSPRAADIVEGVTIGWEGETVLFNLRFGMHF
jgi:hypothetical protein